jgi:phage host-nuclease inhibitor protein Gam
MGSVSQEEAIPRLEELLEKLSDEQAKLDKRKARAEKEHKAILAKHGPVIDRRTEKIESLVTEITKIFTEHREHLLEDGGKSVTLRGGELSARFAAEALEIDDEYRAELWLRGKGRWQKYSKAVKRKLDKAALKKDKDLVNSAPDDIMRLVQNENLHIKLPKLKLEIRRVLDPLRTRLTQSN